MSDATDEFQSLAKAVPVGTDLDDLKEAFELCRNQTTARALVQAVGAALTTARAAGFAAGRAKGGKEGRAAAGADTRYAALRVRAVLGAGPVSDIAYSVACGDGDVAETGAERLRGVIQ